MIDKEKVLKGLECCCQMDGAVCRTECPYRDECINKNGCFGIAHLCANALELLKEQPEQKFFVDSNGKITPLPIQQEWINVKDRLPDDASDVLAYYDDGTESRIIPVNYYKGCWYDCVFNRAIDGLETGFIKYWMSLPKAPEVKQNETD